MAYGQTNSGKTYTIIGPSKGSENFSESNYGVVKKSIKQIFDKVEEHKASTDNEEELKLELRVFEIYCEKIYDLLTDPKLKDKKKLSIRENKHGTYVDGINFREINSFEQAIKIIELASSYRHVAATKFNLNSSRSH